MSSHAAFVSYSREDSEFALRLAQDLKKAGAHIWLDQMDIQPGYPWDNAIEDALMASPLMLLILSPSSAKSDNVRNEISFALEQGKTVIPVLYMNCVVPLRLQRTQRIDFRSDYARGLTSLLEQLQVSRPDPAVIQKVVEEDANRKVAWKARDVQALKLAERIETPESIAPIVLAAPSSSREYAPSHLATPPAAQAPEPRHDPTPPPRTAPLPPIPASAPPPSGEKPTVAPQRLQKRIRAYLIASIALFVLFLLCAWAGAGAIAGIFFILAIFPFLLYVRARRQLRASITDPTGTAAL